MVRISCHELDFLNMKNGVLPLPIFLSPQERGWGGLCLSETGLMIFVRIAPSLTTLEENNEYPAFT
jgi:hypothetical protein